ncbi:MAG TPA: hypothetical protein VFB96_11340 [Pirellulaceae bacterium]|nr:hypothetical protein [Pirellulaceae bacterium]
MNRTIRDVVAFIGVGMAAFLGLLGQMITFVPGRQMGWFAVAASLAAAGLLSPRWWLRFVALALVIGLACRSCAGYVEGLRYEEFLRSRNLTADGNSPSR